MNKRILTLVIEIDDIKKPNWIWESHKNGEYINDIFIMSISEGNCLEEFEKDDLNDNL